MSGNRKQRKVGDQPATTRHLGLGHQSTGVLNVRLNEIVCGLSMYTERNRHTYLRLTLKTLKVIAKLKV